MKRILMNATGALVVAGFVVLSGAASAWYAYGFVTAAGAAQSAAVGGWLMVGMSLVLAAYAPQALSRLRIARGNGDKAAAWQSATLLAVCIAFTGTMELGFFGEMLDGRAALRQGAVDARAAAEQQITRTSQKLAWMPVGVASPVTIEAQIKLAVSTLERKQLEAKLVSSRERDRLERELLAAQTVLMTAPSVSAGDVRVAIISKLSGVPEKVVSGILPLIAVLLLQLGEVWSVTVMFPARKSLEIVGPGRLKEIDVAEILATREESPARPEKAGDEPPPLTGTDRKVRQFADEVLVSDPLQITPAGDVYAAYLRWCQTHAYDETPNHWEFAHALRRVGVVIQTTKVNGGRIGYVGLVPREVQAPARVAA